MAAQRSDACDIRIIGGLTAVAHHNLAYFFWVDSASIQNALDDSTGQFLRGNAFERAADGSDCRTAGFNNDYISHNETPLAAAGHAFFTGFQPGCRFYGKRHAEFSLNS
jgi:hypothetical protein